MVFNLVISTLDKNLAMLWLVSYTFLLRVPSEALPMAKGDADAAAAGTQQSVLFLENGVSCVTSHVVIL